MGKVRLKPGLGAGGWGLGKEVGSVSSPAPSPQSLAPDRLHVVEYLCEAAELALFMLSACLFTALLFHPGSPASGGPAGLRMVLMGLAMGATAVAIVYSPLGQRSGAHFNPSVTLTFWRLGKIETRDAVFYVAAQFAGGTLGVVAAGLLLSAVIAHPSVNYAVTVPGPRGAAVAFAAEASIAFVLMSVILRTSNHARLSRFTPLFSGALVATYIAVEAPLSGMSMNPARTFASALPANVWTALWIYFTAPIIGMLLAAEIYLRRRGSGAVYCAKLHHHNERRCIFRCRWHDLVGGARGWGLGAGRKFRTSPQSPVPSPFVRLLVLLVVLSSSAPADAQLVTGVDSIGLTVSDLDRSVHFYTRVLSFEKVAEVEVAGDEVERLDGLFGVRKRVARLRLGAESLVLTEYLAPEGRPAPADARSNDHWFQHVAIVVRDMDEAYRHLRAHRARHASSGPQRLPDWNPNAAGIEAFYFKDPDGHALEVIRFPAGKGDPRWQKPSDRLFLGIDHTAIVVADTEESLRFYRDFLGLAVAGESENHGPEQEHLNNVFGARLRITGLRAAAGPGVEFLEYLAPRDGRAFPADERANDLIHWQTQFAVGDAAAAADGARRAEFRWVSSGAVELPDAALGFREGVSLRDPTGHVVQLVEK